MNDVLNVMVMTPQKRLYQGPAISVTSVNSKGVFDILSSHANFICLIKDWLTIRTADKEMKMQLVDGVLRVYQNTVVVFIGINSGRN